MLGCERRIVKFATTLRGVLAERVWPQPHRVSVRHAGDLTTDDDYVRGVVSVLRAVLEDAQDDDINLVEDGRVLVYKDECAVIWQTTAPLTNGKTWSSVMLGTRTTNKRR